MRRAIETCTFRPREQAFTTLINISGRLKEWRKAVEVFETMKDMKGVRVNTYTFSALISACSSCGEWDRALEFFEEMKVQSTSDPGCRPNQVLLQHPILRCRVHGGGGGMARSQESRKDQCRFIYVGPGRTRFEGIALIRYRFAYT